MTATSTVVGASVLAHGIHLGVVLLGLWGLVALLLPQALERRGARPHVAEPRADEHALRVAALRTAAATGTLTLPRTTSPGGPDRTDAPPAPRQPVLGLPLALVAGTTAAGIHAAVAPAHLVEEPAYGVFFLLVAAAQLTWVVAVSSAPSPRIASVLRIGIVLHGALVVLWLVTRLFGLPFGLMPEPHPVGAWDIACVLWQVACIASCVRVIRGRAPTGLTAWSDWHPSTRGAVGAAAVVIVLLTLVGAHS